jgi:DNA-binding transcriptional MerR regulator
MGDKNINDGERFPIRELSARTQVNTVTIRAWERRYGLLKPERTAKGHRLYSEEDVSTIEKIIESMIIDTNPP